MSSFPTQFDSTPVLDLLKEAERGLIGFDQRLLRSLLSRRQETIAALVQFEKEDHDGGLVDLTEQIFDLYRYLHAPEAMPFYLELMTRTKGSLPDELVEAVSDLGAAAVDPLLDQLGSVDEDDRTDVVFLLSAMGVPDERIRVLILEALHRDPYEGALCIGLYHDPTLLPEVEAALAKIRSADGDEHVIKLLEECIASLKIEQAPREIEAFDILALYPEESYPLFDQMEPDDALGFFSAPLAEYRAAAAAGFIDDEYPDSVRDALIELTKDPDVRVRKAALNALGERAESERPIRDLLSGALKERREEWTGALIALAGHSGNPDVHQGMLDAYANEATRADALLAMWRSLDARYTKFFAPHLRDADESIRRQAVQGVGAFPLEELALELVPLFNDEAVREEALFSYALAVSGKISKKRVERLLEDIGEKAGGLTNSEEESVMVALDQRLARAGLPPEFFPDEEHAHNEHRADEKVGRNDPCPCGSGKKYKKCCGQ